MAMIHFGVLLPILSPMIIIRVDGWFGVKWHHLFQNYERNWRSTIKKNSYIFLCRCNRLTTISSISFSICANINVCPLKETSQTTPIPHSIPFKFVIEHRTDWTENKAILVVRIFSSQPPFYWMYEETKINNVWIKYCTTVLYAPTRLNRFNAFVERSLLRSIFLFLYVSTSCFWIRFDSSSKKAIRKFTLTINS